MPLNMVDNAISLIVKTYWGYTDFRSIQKDIIKQIIQKNDVLALLPTGGGKSLCFQIPGLYFNKTTLVISPLVALMQDQVNDLIKKNIAAVYLQGHIDNVEYLEFETTLLQGNYQFVYIAPERLISKKFQELIQKSQFGLIAIDEAHCISQFGHDFRPAYLQLNILKKLCPEVPILALTASATTQVQDDIFNFLFLKKVTIFQGDFSRKNLSYSCFNEAVKMNKIIQILSSVKGSALVYCATQTKTEICYNMLLKAHFKADFYHAGLSLESRTTKLKNWLEDDSSIMVCSNAFGMGINKPNVRCVIHHDIPNSPENYYQEAGRAGRDNKNAFAVLLYTQDDIKAFKTKLHTLNEPKHKWQEIAQKLFVFSKTNASNVNLGEFININKITFDMLQNVLLYLEHGNYIKPLDKSTKPDKIKIIITVDAYNHLVIPSYEYYPVLSCLVKLVSHLFTSHVSVPMLQMCAITSLSTEAIQNQLEALHHLKIIDYKKNHHSVNIEWLCNDIPKSGFVFDDNLIIARQQVMKQQIQGMLAYLNLASQACRAKYLAQYFSQSIANDCQICDLCLERKNQAAKQQLYAECWQILQRYAGQPFKISDLLNDFSSSKKSILNDFLKEMIDKNKIIIDEQGFLKEIKN